jgi:hypothetical protein
MIRINKLLTLVAFAATIAASAPAWAVNAWLSLNLQFNTANDFNSGGTWTVVGKAEEMGFAGINMYLANINFDPATGFIAPSELEERFLIDFSAVKNIVVGDDILSPPLTLHVGVIGGAFPSTYVDPAGIVVYGGNPDLGSFTGGVALATGSFNAGVVPNWTTQGTLQNRSDSNIFVGTTFPGAVSDANTLLTVRYVVPEPGAFALAALGAAAVGLTARRRR